ncbi:MAG: hypothetical protein J6B92_08040 [Paraprevotella sp.]|nr:hypothetical protein [Paraprevotella sp.]
MDDLDKELLQDAEEDMRTVAFIQNYLPQETKGKFSEEDLLYLLDVITDYYATSGVLEQDGDENGEIEIDMEKVVDYILKVMKKDGTPDKFNAEDLLWVVEAELEYAAGQEEEE